MKMTQEQALALLESQTVQTSATADTTYKDTTDRDYAQILRYINVTSYSQLEEFHRCPRKFQKRKEEATRGQTQGTNIDFAFGHAVGAGVQNYLIHGNLRLAVFNCAMAWKLELSAEIKRSKKSLWSAMIAVERFAQQSKEQLLEDWELLVLPNGKPAIETSFSLHCGNGFKHYLHMDVGLRNRRSNKVAVLDVKTTGFDEPEEALYANSSQALSYSILLETALGEELTNYEVFYLVYAAPEREWHLLPFVKSALDQAEFIKDLLITQDAIKTYNEVRFFPKRGQACYDFRRRCQYFGECNLINDEPLPVLEEDKEVEKSDYIVPLPDVIDRLKQRKKDQAK